MSLRARLVASFTGLLLIAIATVGGIAAATTRAELIDQIDGLLIEVDQRLTPLRGRGVDELIRRFVESAGLDPRGQDIARLVYLPDEGRVLVFDPSRYGGEAPPDITQYSLSDPPTPQTISAVTGNVEYRTIGRQLPGDDRVEYFAVPLSEVEAVTADLLNRLLIAGAAVLLLGAAATWWTVRRDLRPVEDMIDTAEAIGRGDFSRRVPAAPDQTELGRLGHALNRMLGNIEQSIESQQEAQASLEQFIADASHELRTPITSIKGYAELYRAGGLDEEGSLANAMGRIEKESARMGGLVEDLLLLAKLDRDTDLEMAPVDLRLLIDDAVADIEAVDSERHVTVSGTDQAVVAGDEARLTQVVANLLSNARLHTPPGSPIDVEVGRSNDAVVITITDDGPGIPDDELDRVFDRFHRVDTSRARKSGGSGLGLSIVSAIVEAHAGTVTAANAPGRGARFVVTLPATSVHEVSLEAVSRSRSDSPRRAAELDHSPRAITARSTGGEE